MPRCDGFRTGVRFVKESPLRVISKLKNLALIGETLTRDGEGNTERYVRKLNSLVSTHKASNLTIKLARSTRMEVLQTKLQLFHNTPRNLR